MMIYEQDGAGAWELWVRQRGYHNDATFKACLQALLNAIPRTRIKGKFSRPEAEILENMRLTFFEELQAPVEEEPEVEQVIQARLEGMEEVEKEEEEQEDE